MLTSTRRRLLRERLFVGLCASAVVIPLLVLALLVGHVALAGLGRIDWAFLSGYPSRRAATAGILPAMVGSLYMIAITAALALPVGVGAAIFLEEYGARSRLAAIIEVNIANLAGVPSIIYGMLGLGVFVRLMGFGRTLIAGAATMALLVLPVVIVSSREALRTVPYAMREACFGLGATKWQAIRQVVLPMAAPGILTGTILAVARAIGETAPLVVIGALAYVTFLPTSPTSQFTALPMQILNWVSRPQEAFVVNAAAGIVVLLITMLVLNLAAILLRNRLQKRVY
ncbi:MAG: phosphate ABC transporter permease PstA [Myxococcales bacterium]|nr:phosphate ABC transporter permease PstA [Myxococcales bacterium]